MNYFRHLYRGTILNSSVIVWYASQIPLNADTKGREIGERSRREIQTCLIAGDPSKFESSYFRVSPLSVDY